MYKPQLGLVLDGEHVDLAILYLSAIGLNNLSPPHCHQPRSEVQYLSTALEEPSFLHGQVVVLNSRRLSTNVAPNVMFAGGWV